MVRETFDLRRLVESIVELLAPQAQGKGLEISASIAADAPRFVVGDSLRLRQALINLAGNAVKFTQSGGVGVSIEKAADGRVLFKVMDTGPGVPADRRAAIFEDFEQGDGSHARHYEGTGLGLAISKRIVALMGGDSFWPTIPAAVRSSPLRSICRRAPTRRPRPRLSRSRAVAR